MSEYKMNKSDFLKFLEKIDDDYEIFFSNRRTTDHFLEPVISHKEKVVILKGVLDEHSKRKRS